MALLETLSSFLRCVHKALRMVLAGEKLML